MKKEEDIPNKRERGVEEWKDKKNILRRTGV